MSKDPTTTVQGTALARRREAETIRVWLLGGFRVTVGSRTVQESGWRLKKARSLVKLLALGDGHKLHRGSVEATLWPNLNQERASNNLHRALHSARRTLEPASAVLRHLSLVGDMLELCPDGSLWVDVEAFEEVTDTARRSREPAAYQAAIELYAGDLLPEDRYEAWTEERRGQLRREHHALLTELAALYEEREEYAPAVTALERAVAREPADEQAHLRLMRLCAAEGRRHEALLHYHRLRKVLSEQFGLRPTDDTERLHASIRAGRHPDLARSRRGGPFRTDTSITPGNLPAPLSSFVGRKRALAEVRRSLAMTRLLSLTGTGGAGKTRLAMEAARGLVGAYPDGIWLAELAPITDPTLVPRSVAAALGVHEQPDKPLTRAICDHVGSGQMLLVLDNCEHLVAAAALVVSSLLRSCPRLRVLATSREALNVAGETVWPVPPLSLPDPDAEPTVQSLAQTEAVQLFVARARSRLPAFTLTPQNARAVASICQKLDGIPLAIELSTARVGALAVEHVAGRLEDSLRFLTGGDRAASSRHRTLRATLDWSYGLISEPERELFGRLSVFAGGWTLGAAKVVGAGRGIEAGEVPDILARLVDKSMVVVEPTKDGGLRYGMLYPVRQYGQERLGASGEADAVRRRHASWYFGLATKVEPWLRGARQEVWLEQLEKEYGNLRAALEWALEKGETDLGLWFGGALGEFWYMSGRPGEGRRWLEAALAIGADAPPTPARTEALARAGWIAWEQGDYESSQALGDSSLASAREAEDKAGIAAALSTLGWAAFMQGELEKASALADEAAKLGRELNDAGGVARALLVPGLVAVVDGDHERALALVEESLALARSVQDDFTMAVSLGTGAFACLGRGDLQRAQALCLEGFAVAPRPRVMNVTVFHLHASAATAGSQGHFARSARLWGAAESLRKSVGAVHSPTELRVYVPHIDAARARLDGAAWQEAWAKGNAMTAEEAEDYATSQAEQVSRSRPRAPAPQERPVAQSPGPLTPRQEEVALLVAHGLTNRQIASELTIAEATVASHVAALIRKLNVYSRSQIAVWVTEKRLRMPDKGSCGERLQAFARAFENTQK